MTSRDSNTPFSPIHPDVQALRGPETDTPMPILLSRTVRHFSFASLLVAVMLTVAACSGADGASDQDESDLAASTNEGTRVESMILQPTHFADVIELTGTVEAVDDATLSAQSAGTVVALADLGDYVQRGAAVAQLDPQLARAAVEQAEASVEAAQAQYNLAEDNYQRQTPLYRDSIISAIEYESVRAQLSQARAQLSQANAMLASAEKQLQNTSVRTPFAGIVEQQFVERGEQVTPGMPVARVVNSNQVKVSAGVPERYAGDIEVGAQVEVRLNAYNVGNRLGRVSFVGSAIDTDSRTFPIEVRLDNASQDLKPQMVAQVMVTREDLEGAIVVPREAVLRDELGTAVFVVERSGDSIAVAQRRHVQLGASYGGRVVVTSGLASGDEVVVAGQTNLTEGDAVRVVAQTEQPVAAREAGATE